MLARGLGAEPFRSNRRKPASRDERVGVLSEELVIGFRLAHLGIGRERFDQISDRIGFFASDYI
jgi:hypothetical protein